MKVKDAMHKGVDWERLGPSLKRFGALAPARVTRAEQTCSALYSAGHSRAIID